MKDYEVIFRKISENKITISALNKDELFKQIDDLFYNTDLKNKIIDNITDEYYEISIDNNLTIKRDSEVIEWVKIQTHYSG